MKSKFYLVIALFFLFPFVSRAQVYDYLDMLGEEWINNTWRNQVKTTNEFEPGGKIKKTTLAAWDTLAAKWVDYTIMTYTLNGDNTVKETLTKIWNEDDEIWENGMKTTFTYNSSKDVLTQTIFLFSDPDWMEYSSIAYTYNSSGQLTRELVRSLSFFTGMMEDYSEEIYEYNTDGTENRSTYRTKPDGSTTFQDASRNSYGYKTENGQKVVATVLFEIFDGENWISDSRSLHDYNSDATVNEVVDQDYDQENWINSAKEVYSYKNGKVWQVVSQEWDPGLPGWVNISRVTFNYQGTTGVPQMLNADVRAFPNPFTSEVRIGLSGSAPVRGQIFSLTGQLILDLPEMRNGDLLHLEQLPRGSYFLRTATPEGGKTIQLIKSR